LPDPVTVGIALVTLGLTAKTKIPEPAIIITAALVGVAVRSKFGSP
jgi:hypothetical protein